MLEGTTEQEDVKRGVSGQVYPPLSGLNSPETPLEQPMRGVAAAGVGKVDKTFVLMEQNALRCGRLPF